MRTTIAFVLTVVFAFGAFAPDAFALGSSEPSSATSAVPLRSLSLRNTSGFAVDYYDGFKIVTVKTPWPGAETQFRYVLYPRGSKRPADPRLAGSAFIEIPLRRVATFSTSYLPSIVALGKADTIMGVDSADFVNAPEVRARIAKGQTVEVTRNWMPDIERLMAIAPDAIFTYGMGNEWDTHPKLAEAGLPVVINGEWNERDPLGRAEWIKFIAAFYDEEAKASAIFDAVAAEYAAVKALAAKAVGRPEVLLNGPFQGSWSVAGGRSFMSVMIADAGGRYLWSDDPNTGALVLSVEAVFERAKAAKVWLNPSLMPITLEEVKALDSRFADLPVFKSGQIWNSNLKVNAMGGNDYYESAVIRPDLVLVDLIKILHPELLEDRPFTWYRKMQK